MANIITTQSIETYVSEYRQTFRSTIIRAVLTLVKSAIDQVYVDLAALEARVTALETP